MNHTPGPWAMQVFTAANGDLCPGVVGANGAAVAWLNNETDARLIACAPALLEALRRIVASDDAYLTINATDGDDIARMVEYAAAFDTARAAIKKATGVQA